VTGSRHYAIARWLATLTTVATAQTPNLVSVADAAKLARVSRDHIYDLIHRGTIEAVRVGDGTGPLRINRDKFLAWLYGPADEGDAAA